MIKSFGVILITVLMTINVNATVINGVEYGEGLVLQTGSVFFNTGELGVDEPVVSEGIGQILAIYQNSDIIWQNGDNGVEYNMVFDNVILEAFDGPNIFGSINYGDILGNFSFYTNPIGTFNPTGDHAVDSSAISSGDLNLSGSGHPVFGFTVTGTSNETSNTGTGQLDVFGGDAIDLIVQDSIERLDDTFADITFNYSTDTFQTFGYDWSGSVDMAMVTRVPEPSALALLGLGLLGFGLVKRKKV